MSWCGPCTNWSIESITKPSANESEKAQFIRNADQATVERCKWEARPIEFPGAGKNFNLTAQSKIATVPRLSALWDAMVEQERVYVTAEKAALQQQRQAAEARLKELEAAAGTPQPERLLQRARIGAE
jgi:multidrug efflux pump subunit AcrA (membrane-fusion protein)